jgi:hypothetical protein
VRTLATVLAALAATAALALAAALALERAEATMEQDDAPDMF